MSNQDGGYGGGMALNDRVARRGPSHQTSHKGHVRASLHLLARLTILTLPLLTLFEFVQCCCQWCLTFRPFFRSVRTHKAQAIVYSERPCLGQLCPGDKEQVTCCPCYDCNTLPTKKTDPAGSRRYFVYELHLVQMLTGIVCSQLASRDPAPPGMMQQGKCVNGRLR